jgi:hypothetical protein
MDAHVPFLPAMAGCSGAAARLARAGVALGGRRAQTGGASTPHWGETMLHELRIYECVPGRLPDLLKRFDTITLKLWEKHGIRQAGFWTTVIGESNQTLYYLVEWQSLAEREQKWNAFGADPEWLKARAQTEANGAIVANVKNFILAPTSFSAVK